MYDVRVSARLDQETEAKLAFLQKETGLSVRDIVRDAISSYYARVRAMGLVKTSFVGCGDGPADLSANYKKELQRLQTRHRVR